MRDQYCASCGADKLELQRLLRIANARHAKGLPVDLSALECVKQDIAACTHERRDNRRKAAL